jgi:UDP-N-acetylmuramoyl-tripeptide--D-alanyl-D-alanine ligase
MFRVSELIKATRADLISGRPDLVIKGISIDSRRLKKGNLFIAIKGVRFDGHDFIKQALNKGAKAVICGRHYPIGSIGGSRHRAAFILVEDTRRALGDIAYYQRRRFFNIPVIGITGSNGKTTTKDMVSFLLDSKFRVLKTEGTQNNDIGISLALLNLDESFEIAVLEVGTNHFGEIHNLSRIAQPNIGLITNIGPAHLEFLNSRRGVYLEKTNLIKNLVFPRIALVNRDDYFLRSIKDDPSTFVIGFARDRKAEYRAYSIKYTDNSIEFLLNGNKVRINTLSAVNVYNTLAAVSIARIFGIDYAEICQRLKRFEFRPQRLTLFKQDGIRFIDDTYNSNPLSLSAAFEVIARFRVRGSRIVIFADMLELGSQSNKFHIEAGKKIAKIFDIMIAVGTLAKTAALAAIKAGLKRGSVFICDNSRQAKKILFNIVKPGKDDIILIKGSRLMKMEEVFN